MSYLYSVEGVSKNYGQVRALTDVDFGVRAGEVVGLVGDNGAGKSTLVKVLSGVHQPEEGRVLLEGRPQHFSNPQQVLRAGIETLYQDSGLAPHLSVSANLFLGRERRRAGILGRLGFLANREMDEYARVQLENVGIAVPSSQRPVSLLSGGQRQAVAIGQAVAWAKKVIILDEPTNHLGARQSGEVLDVIRRAKHQGLGVIFISHTLPHVLEVTDRVVVLRLGRVAADAPTGDFTSESLLAAITGLAETTN